MCGIVGVVATGPVNQLLYDSLQLLQHRGQDAAGIATGQGSSFVMWKGNGMVREIFRTRNMRNLVGNVGIAHVRYPTAGSASNVEEAQPFYVNAPFGITLGHNGNLTNTEQLKSEMFRIDRRHINTNSDSEVLLNVLAHELQEGTNSYTLDPATIFGAVAGLHRRVRGAYACVAHIAGHGILAFRDPFGIRPLCYGINETDAGTEYLVASESVAIEGLGFKFVRDVAPGEAIFIDIDGNFYSQQCAEKASLNPCIFEYVYFARPDSVMDGVSVYGSRLKMGEHLAEKVERQFSLGDIDVVMPIPDTSRPAAMQLAMKLGLKFREGFFKNRYVGRTFIMPGQAVRRKSVRQKLTTLPFGVQGQERAARRRFHRARDHFARNRPHGARVGSQQGHLRFGGAAGALPQRLRDRHADPQRADRARPVGRGDRADDRGRRPRLPGHRGDEALGAGTGAAPDELRGELLRRRLHHRRRHTRVPRSARSRARTRGRQRRRAEVAIEPEPGGGRLGIGYHPFIAPI